MLFGLALAALIPTGQPLTVFDTPSGGGLSDSYADNPVYTVREDMNVIWNTDLDNTDFYVFLRYPSDSYNPASDALMGILKQETPPS